MGVPRVVKGETAKTITLLLGEPRNMVRQGLRLLLEKEAGLRVLGEAATGGELLDAALRLQPNVLIASMEMPELSGPELVQKIAQSGKGTRVILLSSHPSQKQAVEALRSGALGYVLKHCEAEELFRAVHAVMEGRTYVSPPFSRPLVEKLAVLTKAGPKDPYEKLTKREREVLSLAVQGHTNAQIAHMLSISPRTAETHRANLMRKLGIKNQIELVLYAIVRQILVF